MKPPMAGGAVWALVCVATLQGCAMGSLAQTSRFAFSPPLIPVIDRNYELKDESGPPLARRYSFAWQNVEQALEEDMRIDESEVLVGVTQVPGNNALAAQAQQRADDASERGRAHSRLADAAESGGNRAYHRSMAVLNADQAIVQQEMAVAQGRTDAAIGFASAGLNLYSSLAAAGKSMNDHSYGMISRDVVEDLHAVDAQAPEGSLLHLEFHYGLEPSMGKQFHSGLAAMFGGSTDQNNAFMVTAVLTLPDGRRVTSTRLAKMIWYAGEGNLERDFPPGYQEMKLGRLPRAADNAELNPLPYGVVDQLARAAVHDIRAQLEQ